MKSRNSRSDNHSQRRISVLTFSVLFLIIITIGSAAFYVENRTIIWEIDGIGQYLPAFLYIGKYIRGIFSGSMPVYDLSIAFGENIAGVLNYYGFGEPINLIAVFATEDNGYLVLTIAFFARLYLAGLAMIRYLNTIHVGKRGGAAAVVAYLFTGFTLFGGLYYIEWLSALIYLPLMLTEAERLIRGQKRNPIIFSLVICYAALCGFYYLYMTSLALVVYCVVRMSVINGKIKITKKMFDNCLKLLGEYILGIGLAAPILFQAIAAFGSSERNSRAVSAFKNISNCFLSKSALKTFVTRSLFSDLKSAHSYELGVTVFHWAAILYIFIKAIVSRGNRDIQLVIGIVLTAAAVSLPVTGYVFNGFSNMGSSDAPTRWYFLVHFFAAVILAVSMDELGSKSPVWSKLCYCVCGLIVLNVAVNVFAVYADRGLNLSDEFVPANEIRIHLISPVNDSKVIAADKGVYRVDHDLYTDINGRPDNIAMLNGYNGVSYWFSIINQNTQNYVDWAEGSRLKWRSFGFGMNAYTSSIVGVKYYFAKDDNSREINENFTAVEEITFNGESWTLYRNDLYKGLVYERGDVQGYDADSGESFEEYNARLYEKIDTENIGDVSYDPDASKIGFTADIDEAETSVVIAVPYHWAWNVKVDGEKVLASAFNGLLMVQILNGKHTVEAVYLPLVRDIGAAAALVSIIIIVLKYGLSRRKKIQA